MAHPTLCLSHVDAVSPGVSRHTPVSKSSSCHNIIVCIVTRLTNQTARLSRYKGCIVTQSPAASPSLLSRYKTCIATFTPSQAASARAAGRVMASLGRVAALPWLYRGHGWPCRGPCCCAQDCCVMIQFLVS